MVQHRVEPFLYPLSYRGPGVNANRRERSQRLVRPHRPCLAGRCPGRRCRSGEAHDLNGPKDATRIRHVDDPRRSRVDAGKFRSQIVCGCRLEFRPKVCVRRRELQRIYEGPEVQAGPAGDHDRPTRRIDPVKDLRPDSLEFGDGVLVRGFSHVDEVVRVPAPGVRVRLRRTNVHSPTHLHRIDGEDLRSNPVGDPLGDLGLPGCRWAEYGDDAQTKVPSR
jgi:hypothetical protein